MTEKDRLKKRIDQAGVWLCTETGFIHEAEKRECVSFQANLDYALALFHLKTSESLKEGKELLYRLLHYISDETNLFPRLLSDYPHTFDCMLSVEALIPLLKIRRLYHNVLSQKERDCLEDRLQRSYQMSEGLLKAGKLKRASLIKVWIACKEYCDFFKKPLQKEPEVCLDLEHTPREELAKLYLYSSLLKDSELATFQKSLKDYLQKVCHKNLGYVGPLHSEEWDQGHLKPSLFEVLFLEKNLNVPQDLCIVWSYPNPINFVALTNASYVVSTFTQELLEGEVVSKKSHPLYIKWEEGTKESASLALSAQRASVKLIESTKSSFVFEISSNTPFQQGKKGRDEELSFFITKSQSLKILVSDAQVTCFELLEPVVIQTEHMKIHLSLSCLEGKGTWKGHLALTHRGSIDSENLLDIVPEWKLFYRTVRREDFFRFRLELKIETL